MRNPNENFENLITKLQNFVPDHDYSKTHTKIDHSFCPHHKTDIFGLENAENIANFSMHDEL